MGRRAKVGLLIESSRAYGRGLLRGIAAYVRTHGPWSIYYHERGLSDASPAWIQQWTGDGIIARAETKRLAQQITQLGVPVVDLRGLHMLSGIPNIESNDKAIVRLALDHLRQQRFKQYAFCGYADANYSQNRLRYYRELLATEGVEPEVYEGTHAPRAVDTTKIEAREVLHEKELEQWLANLPHPMGLMACNDIRAQQVLNSCREIDIAVPDEVAVIGVDNDDVLCEMCHPSLSSVLPDAERIGYEAASLLDRMMQGEPPPQERIFIDPLHVVSRQSTDVFAIEDRDVAAALRFIREHACDDILVGDVVRHVALSRSSLERRFARAISRSPKEEINRIKLHRVKQLLVETKYTLETVSQMAGFKHREYMSASFTKKVGCTPGEYRKARRSAKG